MMPNRKCENGITIIFIVGLYKSGTSLITKLVEEMGFSNLDDLWDDHVEGVNNKYYTHESKSVNELNDKIIRYYFGGIHSLPSKCIYRVLNKLILVSGIFRNQIENIVKSIPAANLVIKDPRFCITLPLWLSALERFVSIKLIWVIRDRSKVVRSWMRDDWCIKYLNLTSELHAFKLAAKYESYLLMQYLDYSIKFDNFIINLEALKHEPVSSVRLLMNFVGCSGDVGKLSKIVKK